MPPILVARRQRAAASGAVAARRAAGQLTEKMQEAQMETKAAADEATSKLGLVKTQGLSQANKAMWEEKLAADAAASEKAEADKVLLVKAAEADAESKYLSGVGVARQRKVLGFTPLHKFYLSSMSPHYLPRGSAFLHMSLLAFVSF